MKKIYMDNSATTQVDPQVFEAMKPYFTEHFGNPGSLHSFGQETKKAVDEARKTIAAFLGCKPEEIVFTSGGSESDNLAIRGLITAVGKGDSPLWGMVPKHVITSAFEHRAVLDTVKSLEKSGQIEATYIKPDAGGLIRVDDIKAAIRDNTVLISIMHVNNEVGTIQPIREIGRMISETNSKIKNLKPEIYFHTDAVQAIEYCKVDPNYLGVDLLSASAHKFYGPKGVGFLYVRNGTPLIPEITGGGQERGLRASTENAPGIVGMAAAINLINNSHCEKSAEPALDSDRGKQSLEEIAAPGSFRKGWARNDERVKSIKKLRDKLINGILKTIPDSILNGDREHLAPHIANISFINAEGESILLNLDFLGIAVSTGSACTSRSLVPSHVLTSMNIPPEKAHGSIRFSLGRQTTGKEINRVLEVLPGIIKRLREMSPFK